MFIWSVDVFFAITQFSWDTSDTVYVSTSMMGMFMARLEGLTESMWLVSREVTSM
jgi:hypothetical protein